MALISQTKKTVRLFEIEGLRAIAVVAVIFNHYFENLLPSGFLGVDVFFVISGFVITKYLTESYFYSWGDLLLQFYSRRVKRLIPALLFCVAITSVVFVQFTTRPPADVFRTGAFALLGVSNIFLYVTSTDYFSVDAKLNPFTHTWSLGVEEQFYIIFPLLLGIAGFVKIGNRPLLKRMAVFPVFIFGSLALWIYLGIFSQSAQFFLFPARIWELAIGAFCCAMKFGNKTSDLMSSRYISNSALFFLLGVFFVPNATQTLTTIICVFITAIFLVSIRPAHGAYKILTNQNLVRIGTLSYSLYLWHWSILVLGRWTIGETNLAKIICLFLVLVLSLVSFYVVERPFRRMTTRRYVLVIFLGVSAAACVAKYVGRNLPVKALDNNNKLANLFHIKPVPEWGYLECHGRDNTSKFAAPLEHCLGGNRTLEKPHFIYLIGDSHAAQLYWMLQQATDNSPFELKFVNLEDDIPSALMSNNEGGSKTLDFVNKAAHRGDILMVSIHRGQFNDARDKHIPLTEKVLINSKTENFIKSTKPYFVQLNKLGVKIILSKDTPLMKVVSTSAACALQIKLFDESICRVTKKQDLHTREREDFAYQTLANTLQGVYLWDPAVSMYGKNDAIDVLDAQGNYIMEDWHHISQYQSYQLTDEFQKFMTTNNLGFISSNNPGYGDSVHE